MTQTKGFGLLFDPYFAKSADGGKSFGSNVRLSADRFSPYSSTSEHAAAPGPIIPLVGTGEIDVFWTAGVEYRPPAVYLAASSDDGKSFTVNSLPLDKGLLSPEIKLQGADGIRFALDGSGRFHIVYTARVSIYRDDLTRSFIYYRLWDGTSWVKTLRIYNDAAKSRGHALLAVAENGEAYVTWGEAGEVFFVRIPP